MQPARTAPSTRQTFSVEVFARVTKEDPKPRLLRTFKVTGRTAVEACQQAAAKVEKRATVQMGVSARGTSPDRVLVYLLED